MRLATQCQPTTPTKAFLPHQRVTTEENLMSYITENIHLLSNFNADPATIANMKSLVLPWAKKRLSEYQELYALCPEAIFSDEIETLKVGIAVCEQRLQAA